jgi:hypothetical protein
LFFALIASLDDVQRALDKNEKSQAQADDLGILLAKATTMSGFILTAFSAEQKR